MIQNKKILSKTFYGVMFATMLLFAGCNSDDFSLDLPEDMVITIDSVGFDGVRFSAKFQGYRNISTDLSPVYSIWQDSSQISTSGWHRFEVFGDPSDKTSTSPFTFETIVDNKLKPNTTYWVKVVGGYKTYSWSDTKERKEWRGPATKFTTTAAPESSLQLSATATTVSATRVSVQLTISKGNQGLDVTKYGYTYVSEEQTEKEFSNTYSPIKTFPHNETFSLTRLSPNTKYTIVPFAEDRYGRINGKPIEITTPDFDVNEYLSMTVNDVSSIVYSSAIVSVTYKKKKDFPDNVDLSFKIGACYKEAAGTTWYKGEERYTAASDMFSTYSWKISGLSALTAYQAGGFVEILITGAAYKVYKAYWTDAIEFKTPEEQLAVDLIGTYSQVARSSSGANRTGTVSITKGIGVNEIKINAWNYDGGDISNYISVTATVNTKDRTVTIAPGVITYHWFRDRYWSTRKYLNDANSKPIVGKVPFGDRIEFGSWLEIVISNSNGDSKTDKTFYSSLVLTKK